jgi:bifunctional non-homologous end joining protein LigD
MVEAMNAADPRQHHELEATAKAWRELADKLRYPRRIIRLGYAFDILALEGDDLRKLPLHLRKNNLARLLARRPEGIFVSEFEQGEIGPDLFRQACKFGLEGLVSKRRESVYRGGRSPNWIKVKNRSHPAIERVKEAFS